MDFISQHPPLAAPFCSLPLKKLFFFLLLFPLPTLIVFSHSPLSSHPHRRRRRRRLTGLLLLLPTYLQRRERNPALFSPLSSYDSRSAAKSGEILSRPLPPRRDFQGGSGDQGREERPVLK